jgi:hypothetical protein
MEKGLGELGFWLAAGIVVAAMIVSGAIKERDRERDRQAMLRADWERKQAMRQTLLENAGQNMPEVLAYLRERDAAAAARADAANAMMSKNKMSQRQQLAFVGAFIVGAFSFLGGIIALAIQHRPALPTLQYSVQAGRMVPVPPPPPPTGLEAYLPTGVMLAIWAAGLIIAALIVRWGYGKQKNDSQPDA